MHMDILVKELDSFSQFEELAQMQKKIWHLSDRDQISTITLRTLSMEYPIMGIMLGAYQNSEMVGFVICTPTRESNTLYGMIMGVLPEYQNFEVGNKLGFKVLEKCNKENISKICWTYDPLDSKLGHLYLNKWGAIAIKYEANYYQLKDEYNSKLPLDRFIVDCHLQSPRITKRINKDVEPLSLSQALSEFPVADADNYPDHPAVLVKIPADFNSLKKTNPREAIIFRMNTRLVFEEYINNRAYFIAGMYSEELNGERENFYLMEKRNYL
jgi:predicted GNAT superfamily acetyltransferase